MGKDVRRRYFFGKFSQRETLKMRPLLKHWWKNQTRLSNEKIN